jgi:hypothetical protein
MTFLVDYNLDGYALIFLGILTKLGWLEFLPIRFVTFREVDYREHCVERLIEIVVDIEQYKGVGRLFIP